MDIKEVLNFIKLESEFIDDNDASFFKRFSCVDAVDFFDVFFGYEIMWLTYLTKSGQHVVKTVLMDDYLEWRDGIKSNSK